MDKSEICPRYYNYVKSFQANSFTCLATLKSTCVDPSDNDVFMGKIACKSFPLPRVPFHLFLFYLEAFINARYKLPQQQIKSHTQKQVQQAR